MTEPSYRCEHCNAEVLESDAYLTDVSGYDGPITLAFCPECRNI